MLFVIILKNESHGGLQLIGLNAILFAGVLIIA